MATVPIPDWAKEKNLYVFAGLEIIAMKMGFKGKIIFDTTKPDGQLRKPSDTSKLRKYLPDFKFTTIEKGIEQTVQWFVSNYPNLRK